MAKASFMYNCFASACAGASFAVLCNIPDAVLASVFAVPVVIVHRIVLVHNYT